MGLEALAQEEMGRAVARVTLARPVVAQPHQEGSEESEEGPVEPEELSDELKKILHARQEAALAYLAGDDPAARADALIDVLKDQIFDAQATGISILPFLMDLPNEALVGIKDQMPELLSSDLSTLREIAVVVLIRTGEPLASLADRDAQATVKAIGLLTPEQLPADTSIQMLGLVDSGTIDPTTGIAQAVRLSRDLGSLFEALAAKIDAARELTFEDWGEPHKLAMAARQGMNQIDHTMWPAGYDEYKVEPVTEAFWELGHEVFYEPEEGCAKCHGAQGEGGGGYPPLAHSPWLVGDPYRAAGIVVHGMTGEMEYYPGGPTLNAQMESLGHLSDGQIAAALTYARQNFGNFAAPVSPAEVKRARSTDMAPTDATGTWTPTALLAKFPYGRDRILGSEKPVIHIQPALQLPSTGMIQMFLIVIVMMLAILLVTYYGGRGGGHTPAMA